MQIATMIDKAGETAISSLLHNSAALQTLLTRSSNKEPLTERKDKQWSLPLSSPFLPGRDQLQRDAMTRTLLTQARDVHSQSLRHIREMEDYLHSMAQQLGLRTLPPRLTPLASHPAQVRSICVRKYVDWYLLCSRSCAEVCKCCVCANVKSLATSG